MTRSATSRSFLILSGLAFLAAIAAAIADVQTGIASGVIAGVACLAISTAFSQKLRGLSFGLFAATFVTAAMFYPQWFRTWGTFEQKRLVVPLIQFIIFGMGTTLSLSDFRRVLKLPKAVLIGMLLQFTVMPLTGAGLAAALGFQAEVAAGVVLLGSSPGGVSSNVMVYLARGNVALSVTMTACSTLVSPLATPLAMKLLAGQYIEIDFLAMLMSIVKMILLPIFLGLIANKLFRIMKLDERWLHRVLPVAAMAAICYANAIVTALSRDQLLTVGLLLVLAAVVHNAVGYVTGYWGAALAGMDQTTCRTVAIEVGLQNNGMSAGLAIEVLKSSDAALASAIFGPWMAISGSSLASWWRDRPVSDESAQ